MSGQRPSKLQLLCGFLRENWELLALFLPLLLQVRNPCSFLPKHNADFRKIASTLVIFRISPLVGRAFAGWNKGIQERVSLTSSILGNMREVKLLGLTDRWATDIQESRVQELELSKKARILSTYRLVLGTFPTPYGSPSYGN